MTGRTLQGRLGAGTAQSQTPNYRLATPPRCFAISSVAHSDYRRGPDDRAASRTRSLDFASAASIIEASAEPATHAPGVQPLDSKHPKQWFSQGHQRSLHAVPVIGSRVAIQLGPDPRAANSLTP